MTTTTTTLTVATVEERKVPPQNNNLGNMLVFDERITQINNNTALTGRHSGFCVRVRRDQQDMWLCEAGWRLPGIPGHQHFSHGGQIHARGLLDFGSSTRTVAITGGTAVQPTGLRIHDRYPLRRRRKGDTRQIVRR
jgi:hypothetical protein